MIIEFYPNPNKPAPSVYVVPALGPTAGYGKHYDEYYAKKRGVTVEEFIRRDNIVRDKAKEITYHINASRYPFKWEEYEKKGKCRILRIDKTYAEYDHDWPEDGDGPLFLVEAMSEKNHFQVFRATPGFFTVMPPSAPKPVEENKGE
jgi:hypothetical protein